MGRWIDLLSDESPAIVAAEINMKSIRSVSKTN